MTEFERNFNEIKLLEQKLLSYTARRSINALDELLDDDFKEFGASGAVYNKQDILSSLPSEKPREFNAKNFEVKALSQHVFLITYTTTERGVKVLRLSIWKVVDNTPKIVFHQGTEIKNITK